MSTELKTVELPRSLARKLASIERACGVLGWQLSGEVDAVSRRIAIDAVLPISRGGRTLTIRGTFDRCQMDLVRRWERPRMTPRFTVGPSTTELLHRWPADHLREQLKAMGDYMRDNMKRLHAEAAAKRLEDS